MKTISKTFSILVGLFGTSLIVFGSILLQDSFIEFTDKKELCISLVFIVFGTIVTVGIICLAFRIRMRRKLVVGLVVSASLCILSVITARASLEEMYDCHWFTTNVPFKVMSQDGRWYNSKMRQRRLFRVIEDNIAHPEWGDEIPQYIHEGGKMTSESIE